MESYTTLKIIERRIYEMTEMEIMLNQMNYEEVFSYFKSKYGKVLKDYFINDAYKYKTLYIKLNQNFKKF